MCVLAGGGRLWGAASLLLPLGLEDQTEVIRQAIFPIGPPLSFVITISHLFS